MEGLRRGPPGTRGQLTHRPRGLSSGGSSGGGGSAAPGVPGGEMLASAAASRPIPGSGGGCCGGRPASQAARPRSPPPAPTSTLSRGPGAAAWLHPGAAAGAPRAEGRARAPRGARWGCGGEARAPRAEAPAPAGLGRLRPPPRPHRSPLPSAARGPRSPRWAGGASDRGLGPPPLRASRVCDQMCVCVCVCVCVSAPACDHVSCGHFRLRLQGTLGTQQAPFPAISGEVGRGEAACLVVLKDLGSCWQKLGELDGCQEGELCLVWGKEWGPLEDGGGPVHVDAAPAQELLALEGPVLSWWSAASLLAKSAS
ncbi:hypothetical protein J0S82_017287 [Galemys pyrenaicus]|uniref:Uncharacterized protein n=1 Tax=Galemys pyrenaicus TaxID=202257 RepID=A0A8J6AAX2_GALPY|nr:hypothetical protein J0S82_017287 [Galemys pyrenaicus]